MWLEKSQGNVEKLTIHALNWKTRTNTCIYLEQFLLSVSCCIIVSDICKIFKKMHLLQTECAKK